MDAATAIKSFSALAQDTRLEAYRLLVQAGPEGRAAGELAEALGVPANTLSFHLAQLTQAGLTQSRRISRSIRYAADFAHMNALIGFMTENCCGGGASALAPRCAPSDTPSPQENEDEAPACAHCGS